MTGSHEVWKICRLITLTWFVFCCLKVICWDWCGHHSIVAAALAARYRIQEYVSGSRNAIRCSSLSIDHDDDVLDEAGDPVTVESPNFNEVWAEMEKVFESGKAKAIGVSNFSPKKYALRILCLPRVTDTFVASRYCLKQQKSFQRSIKSSEYRRSRLFTSCNL